MNISVCLATYNGAKYIEIQLHSILRQLSVSDEVIILDDFSKDNTLDLVRNFEDKRIKVFKNEINRGHVYSFGKAIELASNELIFMCDQDDIWLDRRLEFMKGSLLKSKALLISTNSNFIDSDGNIIDYSLDGVNSISSDKHFKNILDIFVGKTNYVGCAMAFKKELNKLILPIPSYVESHDLWIAMAANIIKANLHLDEQTLSRRIHGNNASIVKRKLLPKLWSRIVFLISVFQLYYRTLLRKK
jgi:glycosyltransferase involved in cell wall biosynthesis